MFNLLLDAAANTSGGGFLGGLGIWGTVLYIAIFGVFIYFVIIKRFRLCFPIWKLAMLL